MSCDHHRKRDLPLSLIGALAINLLIMALIPWLFRGGLNRAELQPLTRAPVFVRPLVKETPITQALPPPEKPPRETPLPPPEPMLPPLPRPELNPRLDLSPVKVDPRIEKDFELQPLPSPPTPVPPRRDFYRFDELDRQPMSTARMEPIYPFIARRRGIEGSVKVRFFVTRQGRVEDFQIIKAEPPGYFEEAVRETVSSWRFEPGVVNGVKVRTLVETSIVFKLGR